MASDSAPAPRSLFQTSVWAVAEALFASDDGPPAEERLAFVIEDLEHYLRCSGLRTRALVRVSMIGIDLVVPILTLRRPLRWVHWRERVRALASLEHSFAGLLVLFVKTILCLLYYEHPDAEAELLQGRAGCLKVAP